MITKESTIKEIKSGSYSFLYLYFKYQNSILRINTGNKPIKNGMTSQLLYNSTVANYKQYNEATEELKSKVDSYIRMKLSEFKGSVNQKECLKYIANPVEFKKVEPEPEKTVLYYFEEFVKFKNKELSGNSNSMGNYWSLQKNLIDFQSTTGNKLTFEYINSKTFIVDFRAYLNACTVNKTKAKYLKTSSVHTRLNYLLTFYRWINENEIYVIKPNVTQVKIQKFDNEIIALSKDDLKQLFELKGLKPNQQIIVDMFICNCFMGLRFSDLLQLNKQNFMQYTTGEYYIKQTNLKTGIEVQIEIQPTSLNILEKYNFQFPKVTLKNFNKTLHSLLVKRNLFTDMITIQDRQNNTITDIHIERRNLIHSHTCRRTFINLCLQNNVPINTLMKATGHRNLITLQKYIQAKANREVFTGIDLVA